MIYQQMITNYTGVCSNRIIMEIIRIVLLMAVINAIAADEYTLELDWSVTTSALAQVGYVTWNQQTLLTLASTPAITTTHESVSLSFNEGPNQLGIYFIGLSGSLMIDNVKLTKDGKSINYILNGDFQMCQLAPTELTHDFLNQIPGWSAPQITIGRTVRGMQLVLTTQSRSITQSISFGKVSKYQFIDSINAAIQNQAKNIFNANLQSLSSNFTGQNIWNTSFLQVNRTFTSPTIIPSTQQGQNISSQVSQLLQLVTNVTANLLSH